MATPSEVLNVQILENISIISNFIFSFILVVVGVLGYIYYLKVSKVNKKERSIELAKFYKDNILDKTGKIDKAFANLQINVYINKFNKRRHHNFDYHDLSILSSSDINEFMNAPLQDDIKDLISDTLNYLEYFALNFVSGIADIDLIYQVLHQHYIMTIEMLSIYICIANCDEDEFKYYTNVIALYNRWKDISLDRQRLINEKKVDAIDKARIASQKAKEDINKILSNIK